MKCEEFMLRFDAYFDQELSQTERDIMEEHARHCDQCRKEFETQKEIMELLSPADASADIPLSVRMSWRNAVKAEAAKKRKRVWFRTVSGVAAAFVLVFGLQIMIKNPQPIFGATTSESADTAVSLMARSDNAQIPEMYTETAKAPMSECSIKVEDLAKAEKAFDDIAAEYSLVTIGEEKTDTFIEKQINCPTDCDLESLGKAMSALGNIEADEGAFETGELLIRIELE